MKRLGGVLGGLLLPRACHACAVCGFGLGQSRSAFFWTTVALSILPLGLLAAGIYYLKRVGGAWLREEFRERDEEAVHAAIPRPRPEPARFSPPAPAPAVPTPSPSRT